MNNTIAYNPAPEDQIEERQTQGVHNIINRSASEKSRREQDQAKSRLAAMAEQEERQLAALRLGAEAAVCVAGIATLVFLAHVGALAGWIMHLGSVAMALHLGVEIGRAY